MKGGESEYRAVLHTESDEGSERIIAKAERAADGKYCFEKEGVKFRIKAEADRLLIERGGEMSYTLTLRRGQKTKVRILTSFGEVDATAGVTRMQTDERDGRLDVFCEYNLDFAGYTQHHAIHFSVKSNER